MLKENYKVKKNEQQKTVLYLFSVYFLHDMLRVLISSPLHMNIFLWLPVLLKLKGIFPPILMQLEVMPLHMFSIE